MESYRGTLPSNFKPEPAPEIMRKMADFLKENGHECVGIIGVKDHKFKWCQKDVCQEVLMRQNMRKRQEEQDQLFAKLSSEGHTCIEILETYPSRTEWCHSNPCKNDKA